MPTDPESTSAPPLRAHPRMARPKSGTGLPAGNAVAPTAGEQADFIARIRAKREFAEAVSEAAKGGLALSDAAASILSARLFDRMVEAGDRVDKEADGLSLALSRLRLGAQQAHFTAMRLREMEQKMELQRFDAAKAVLEHARELRAVTNDTKLDAAARMQRVLKIMFGDRPANWKPITELQAKPKPERAPSPAPPAMEGRP